MTHAYVRSLAEETARVTQFLPGWLVRHTGGGVFVALKNCRIAWEGQGCLAGVSVDGDTAVAYRADGSWLNASEIGEISCLSDSIEEVLLVASDGKKRRYPGADLLSFGDLLEIEKAMDVLGGVDFGGASLDIRCPACGVWDIKVLVVDGYLSGYRGNVYLCCPGEGQSVPLFDAGINMDAPGRCARCGHQGAVGGFVVILQEKTKQVG